MITKIKRERIQRIRFKTNCHSRIILPLWSHHTVSLSISTNKTRNDEIHMWISYSIMFAHEKKFIQEAGRYLESQGWERREKGECALVNMLIWTLAAYQ